MPTILAFPDRETLQLALATGAVPPEVAEAPAEAALDGDGPLIVQPSKALPRRAWGELKRLGVRSGRASDLRAREIEAVSCWPQLLPLRRDPSAETPGPMLPVVFELPGDQLPALAGEILRLGNDRQGLRWLLEGDDDGADQRPPRALLRAVGPPFYTLLRAIDRDGRSGGLRAFVERSPRLLVELGYTHPLIDRLRPPPGQIVMIEAPRRWSFIAEGPFRDLYETMDVQIPASDAPWRGVESPTRLSVTLRLARTGEAGSAELWVLRDRAEEQLDDLVRRSDDRLLARLAFAVAEVEGRTLAVVRVRPSKRSAPVLVLDGVGYRPYLRLPNLFLPVGTRLQPPLRRDAVARLLANDPTRVCWLDPGESGTFTPESLPDAAFRPLEQWVDYVLDRDHRALEGWARSTRFDFEPFVCRDDQEPDAPRPKRRRRKEEDEELVDEFPAAATTPKASPRPRSMPEPRDDPPTMIAAEPDEAVRRLGALEDRFLAMDAPPDDPARRPLWSEMARLNAVLGRSGDAALCWANALWEGDDPPSDWVASWADSEAEPFGKRPSETKALDRLLADAKPSAADLRALASALVRAAEGGEVPKPLGDRLGRIQPFLERHEATIPVRIAWLAWGAVARLAGNDALALARARDRVLERLHQRGLSRELDLPAFLRVAGTGAGDRARAGREHLLRLVEPMRAWIERGPWVGPYTRALADLVFAFGLARLGDADGAGGLVREGLGALKKNDAVVGWLGRAFDRRVGQALEGKAEGPLPADLLAQLEGMGQVGDGARQRDDKISRYKIDRLREHSRILEPHEKVDPYRHWHGTLDEVARELSRVVDVVDRDELAERMGHLLRVRSSGASAAVRNGQVLRTALDVGFRLGETFAVGLFDRVGPTVERLEQLPRRAELLERAIHLAAHFDQAGHVRSLVARLDALLAGADDRTAPASALEPLLGQCFRGLRKLGLRDDADRLLERMAALILRGRGDASPAGLASSAELVGPGAVAWGRTLRLLLHVAAGWSHNGQHDRSRPIFDQSRALLFNGDLPPIEQTALACGYARGLGQVPPEQALPRFDELFGRLERIHDTFTVGSHYSLSRLDFIEAVVLTLASDAFSLGEGGRRWLEDDEYLVRRRIHRDVRDALGLEA